MRIQIHMSIYEQSTHAFEQK